MDSTSYREVPVISFIGWSGSGKTTFLEQVVRYLSRDGLRVGILKHHGHTTTVDVEDIIITEGFRQQARYIVEFRRKDHNNEQICALDRIIALVCDDEYSRAAARAAHIPAFTLDDVVPMALFLKDWRP